MQEENKLRMGFTETRELMLDIFTNGEIASEPESPHIIEKLAIATPTSFIDYVIVGLSAAVFIAILGAFVVALFENPKNVGLIAFATALMIGILMWLNKYRRDMGKSAFAIKQMSTHTTS